VSGDKVFYVTVEDRKILRFEVLAESAEDAREIVEDEGSDVDCPFDYLEGTKWQVLDVSEAKE
jgi:hypothetical protein